MVMRVGLENGIKTASELYLDDLVDNEQRKRAQALIEAGVKHLSSMSMPHHIHTDLQVGVDQTNGLITVTITRGFGRVGFVFLGLDWVQFKAEYYHRLPKQTRAMFVTSCQSNQPARIKLRMEQLVAWACDYSVLEYANPFTFDEETNEDTIG